MTTRNCPNCGTLCEIDGGGFLVPVKEPCGWTCPDCNRKCGIDFARAEYKEQHEDYHIGCCVQPVEDDDGSYDDMEGHDLFDGYNA